MTNNYGYNFELDNFQKEAIHIIEEDKGYNILVTAHTGSGKSLIAEHAIVFNNNQGKKTIYTSPIKSLSNQKYFDFNKKFNNISFGILTGDFKCNPNAQCIIMTTEILLNIINKISFVDDINLDDVKTVVFDEIHYINDVSRGNVWEQCITMLPSHINQIGLSATIDNANDIKNWMFNCNKLNTYLLNNDKRVVPLYMYALYIQPPSIIDKMKNKYNVDISYINELVYLKNTNDNNVNISDYTKIYNHLTNNNNVVNDTFIINSTINILNESNMLPALFFVFSMNKIIELCNKCSLTLNSTFEQSEVERKFNNYLLKTSLNNTKEHFKYIDDIKKLAIKGYGYHMSGLIPVIKEIIELLYGEGLIKVLFATETLAVGLNFGTKTVVMCSLNKFDGYEFRQLYSSEALQMFGRAGRRGIDTKGQIIYLPQLEKYDNLLGPRSLEKLLTSKPQKITSKYTIDPLTILNYLILDKNIYECISKTLWFNEFSIEITKNKINENIINENKIETIYDNYNFSLDDFNIMKEYYDIEYAEFKPRNYQKLLKKISSKTTDFYNKYHIFISNSLFNYDYNDNLNEMIDIDENIDINVNNDNFDVEKHITTCIDNCKNFLNNNEFNKKEILILGNEVNPLLLYTIITNEQFKLFNEFQMSLILCVLCDPIVKNDNIHNDDYLNDYNINTIQHFINYLDDLNIKLINDMNKLNINVELNNWSIFTNNIYIVNEWIKGTRFSDIVEYFNYDNIKIYENNFIKLFIKLDKVIENVIQFYEFNGSIELSTKLQKINNLIIKDIVKMESLYILMV